MARTAITPIDPTIAGTNGAYSSADQANGNSVAFASDLLLQVLNTNAATRTLTIQSNDKTVQGVTIPDLTYTIPANTGNVLINDVPREFFCQSDGTMWLDWSASTNVTLMAMYK